MATFMNSLTKERAKKAAEEQFSRLASDIQAKKLARVDLENQGDVAVQALANKGSYAVQGLKNVGDVDVTNLQEAGATGRTNIVQAGETLRQNIVTNEGARQFNKDYGLNVRKDVREQRQFDLEQAQKEYIDPFEREARRTQLETETDEARLTGRTSQREYSLMDKEDQAERDRILQETEARQELRRREIAASNAMREAYGLEDLRKKIRRNEQDYLGTIFGGY